MQPGAGKAWSEQVASIEAPQHGPIQTGSDAGDEKRCGSGEFCRLPTLYHFMQGPECEAAARKMLVHRRDLERQRGLAPMLSSQPLDLLAQIGKRHPLPGTQHTLPISFGNSGRFLFCSHLPQSQSAARL
jgi:hypothetical protein